jgi:hypothetical protein
MDLLRSACSIEAAGQGGPLGQAQSLISAQALLHTRAPRRLPAKAPEMMPPLFDDPNRWLECAVKMRLVAAEITDSDGKVIALRVAKDLEWFADWVDLRKNASTTNTR